MSSKNVASLLLILLFLSSLTWAEEDSWTLPETITLLCSDSILKWCDGRKVRYLQTPPPGYKLCGEIAAQKLCNPSGRRFISPGSTPPNQVYKDCALGERIIVERIDLIEPGEQFNPQISEPMSKKEHVEAERGTGSGFCYNAGRFLVFLGPFFVGDLLSTSSSSAEILHLLSLIALLPIAAVIFLAAGYGEETRQELST